MHGNVSPVGEAAISRGVTSDAENSEVAKSNGSQSLNVKSDAIDRGWFAEVVQGLLPAKPGTALHFITGYDERLCQKYAAGHVKPSAYFLRVLIRSEQGEPFFEALMDGCKAQWWLERQRKLRNADKVDAAQFE